MQDTISTGTAAFPALAGQQYMSLTTFRKNGDAVPTPVWFAQVGDRLVVTTDPNSGKVKRIRNNDRVTVAPCKMNGEVTGDAVEASARVLTPEEGAAADKALSKKYGLQKRLFGLMGAMRRSSTVHLEIAPR